MNDTPPVPPGMAARLERLPVPAPEGCFIVNPTPLRVVARLGTRPEYRPPHARDEYDRPDGPYALGQVKSGFFIAVDGRWARVDECTEVNDMVHVVTAMAVLDADKGTPCFLAQVRSEANALPPRR